ncbi:poly-gamma-glutamate synthesis protein (capsule biosynthesis protein) [Kribbella orskensis]|uniref:Poly-gamma-glutamate synthesis protein (Capsule biosynthesis protein) n=1 Tax=Kribbella orskensis TaxID=2512216 RepID=A0ABY2BL69_9ACTN|nr:MULTISPECIES: CapA family protein [Kribbella]TCN38795.1 poly-gamma-glutamate synthesis protein (capsule biosynthesis protein) [Kribbella sp. VKM Ac-2500]TCO20976.1 poly-gamma-glutamate synthesis protein (capsule biosynthesis protein) [Kribbella orskensis]
MKTRLLAAIVVLAGTTGLTGCISDTQAAETTPSAGTSTASKGTKPAAENGPDRITLVATGDVLLHERLWTTAKRDGTNGEWNFAPLLQGVKPLVKSADLAVCHLETPLGTPYSGYPLFQGPPQIVPALKQTGYDVCSTASNHSFDKGAAGVDRTLDTLDKAGLKHTGTARTPEEAATPTIVSVRGVKVALLSYTYGFNGMPYPDGETWRAGKLDVPKIKAMAQKARENGAEIVVVSCHWGDEYSKSVNSQQQDVAAQLLADSNIDLVLGHHAHVVQPLQRIKGKWVAYGLGNLVAAHREPDSLKAEGLLVRFTFQKSGDRWKAEQAEYAPLLMTATLPVRVLDVRRELAKPGISEARRSRLELAERRTTATVESLGAEPKAL